VNARAARRVGVDSGVPPFIHALPALATIPVPKSQTHHAGKKGAPIVASPPTTGLEAVEHEQVQGKPNGGCAAGDRMTLM